MLVVSEPSDYEQVIERLKKDNIDFQFRRYLAAKAFAYTSFYDSLIAGYFNTNKFPFLLTVPLRNLSQLRYGENPHQEAALYVNVNQNSFNGIIKSKILQGKELSYNNYLDLESAWRLVLEFDRPACAIIKHNNPCGCAIGENILDAYKRALTCDPLSAFGGIVALNKKVDEKLSQEITKIFTECVIAPEYNENSKKIFASKKNLRLLECKIAKNDTSDLEFRSLVGGMLIQDKDSLLWQEIKTVTSRTPTDIEMESLKFAWCVCKHTKSNAIVLTRGLQTVGIGAGQMSRIDSLKIALEKMKTVDQKLIPNNYPLVLASDAFFPFPDVVNTAAESGVTAIIQPGGSINDKDSIQAANKHNIAMIFTGMRHFRH